MAFLVAAATSASTVRGEDFAKPPEWTDEVKDVFFEDARKELKGEPPTQADAATADKPGAAATPSEQAVWGELISPESLESSVKGTTNRLAQSLRQPARFKAGPHNSCRRDFTLLGTLFEVIGKYPDDVRWKANAPQMSQVCLQAAEACDEGSDVSLEKANDTLAALEELLRGQSIEKRGTDGEPHFPEFAPLMQVMKLIAEEGLPVALSKKADFRRNADSIAQSAQLLAMLSQVIRGDEYGYADDESYLTHADKLRDGAKELNEAATAQEFEKAVQAMTGVQKACADCHTDFRG